MTFVIIAAIATGVLCMALLVGTEFVFDTVEGFLNENESDL